MLLLATLAPTVGAIGAFRPMVPAGGSVRFRDDFSDTSGLEEWTNLQAQNGFLEVMGTVTWRQDDWQDFYAGTGLGVDVLGFPGALQLSRFTPDVRVNDVSSGLQAQVDATFVYVPVGRDRDLQYILAVWADGRGGDLDIYFSRSGDGGRTWSTSRRLNLVDGTGDQRRPAITVLGNTVHVVWEDDAGIHYTRSADYGQTWLTDVLLAPGGAEPDLAAAYLSSYPTVYLVYRAEQPAGDPDIFARRSRDGGLSWDPPENVVQESPTGIAQSAPALLLDAATGNVWVAWEHEASDGWTDIRAARRMAGGIWPNENVASGPPGSAQREPVLFLSGGTVHCLWTDERSGTSDIYQAYYDMLSLGWAEMGPVTMAAGARGPAALPLGTNVYAAWSATAPGSFPEVWIASYNGSIWQTPLHAGDPIPYLTRTDIVLAQSSLAPGIAALWSDDRADAGDIFIATSDGTFLPSGVYTSTVHDFGDLLDWGVVRWTGVRLDHIAVEMRSGNTPVPDAAWSPWAPALNGSPVACPLARYLQYRVMLSRVDSQTTPILSRIEIEGRPRRGEGVSIPIGRCVERWGELTYDGWAPSGTTLTVNLLDISGTLLYRDVPSPFDLSGLSPDLYRRLRLGVEMVRQAQVSPMLDGWEVAWEEGETRAAFEVDPRSIYTPTVVEFLNRSVSTVPPQEIRWQFGDGESSGLLHPTHTYTLPGSYGVTLTLSGECGTATATDRITVLPLPAQLPEAAFSYGPLCPGEEVPFFDESRDAVWWHWDFGDGTSSHRQFPRHTFPGDGTYTVTLIVSNTVGSDRAVERLEVVPAPTAAFTWTAELLTVAFTSLVSGPADLLWEFGDGMTSTLANPVHTYAEAGSYEVTLHAVNACAEAIASSTVVVTCTDPTDLTFAYRPQPLRAGQQATFTATVRAGDDPLSYAWSFGDGTPAQQGQVVQHVYAAPGSYLVTLTATNPCAEVTIQEPVEVACTPPSAPTFDYSPRPLRAGQVGTFTAEVDAGDEPVLYTWVFGDGTPPQEGKTVQHSYRLPGTYVVTLRAANACGWVQSFSPVEVIPSLYRVYLPVVLRHVYQGDAFEPDNCPAQARFLPLSTPQRHDFAPAGDEDWVYLELAAGTNYFIETRDLTGGADTVISLFRPGQYGTPLAQNDDCNPYTYASCLAFRPTASGRYELRVTHIAQGWGQQVAYTLEARVQ